MIAFAPVLDDSAQTATLLMERHSARLRGDPVGVAARGAKQERHNDSMPCETLDRLANRSRHDTFIERVVAQRAASALPPALEDHKDYALARNRESIHVHAIDLPRAPTLA